MAIKYFYSKKNPHIFRPKKMWGYYNYKGNMGNMGMVNIGINIYPFFIYSNISFSFLISFSIVAISSFVNFSLMVAIRSALYEAFIP